MKTTALIIIALIGVASAFSPQPTLARTRTGRVAPRYKVRDEIANEIKELEGGKVQKSHSHDENPWKHTLEERHETMSTLKHKYRSLLDKEERDHTKKVKNLEEKLTILYAITQELAAKDLEIVTKLDELQQEHDSVLKLIRRIFGLTGERIGKITNGVLRFLHLKKKEEKNKNKD